MVAALTNLQGPDLLIIGIILMVLGAPVLIALAIAFILNKRGKKPPPIPKPDGR